MFKKPSAAPSVLTRALHHIQTHEKQTCRMDIVERMCTRVHIGNMLFWRKNAGNRHVPRKSQRELNLCVYDECTSSTTGTKSYSPTQEENVNCVWIGLLVEFYIQSNKQYVNRPIRKTRKIILRNKRSKTFFFQADINEILTK